MVTLISCLICRIISFILPPNEIGCVFASYTCIRLNNAEKWACDRLTEDADFGKKKLIFSDEDHLDLGGYVNKQNCHIWGTDNQHAYIEKPTQLKTSHCLVRILIQKNNWAIFLRKWARRGRYSQWRSLSGHVEWIFVHNCLTWDTNPGFTSNKPTHYLLEHGDFHFGKNLLNIFSNYFFLFESTILPVNNGK